MEPPGAGPWNERVRTLAQRFRDALFAHPPCVPLLATRPATTPASLALLQAGIELLTEAGFEGEDANYAFQTVFVFVIGHAVFHTAGGQLTDDDAARAEFARGLDWVVAGLSV